MLPWTLRRSALATVALLALGACGDAFTQADASDASAVGPGDAASLDGDAMGDGSVASFCSMQSAPHLFCDDFDDRSGTASAIVQGRWSPGETQSMGASATIDGQAMATPSPPNSFLAQTTAPITTEVETLALLSETVGHLGATQRLQASFEMMVASYGGDGSSDDFASVFVVALGSLTYELVLADASHAYFVEAGGVDGGAPATHTLAAAFATNIWTSTTILLHAPTSTGVGHITITLTVAGQTMIKALDEDLVDNVNVSTATATVDLGIGVKLAASDWAVRFDNVLLDTL